MADGPNPNGASGDSFWGTPGSNLNKTGVLRAFQDSWLKVRASNYLMMKNEGMDMFAGKDPWDLLAEGVKKSIKKKSLRRMLENEWSVTQTNTSLVKELLMDQFDRACRHDNLTWTTKSQFSN